MGLPSIISPTCDSELLFFCRSYMFLTTGALLSAHSFVAVSASLLAVYTLLQDSSSYESFNSQRRLDATLLDRWFVLCNLSTLVSLLGWFLITLSTFQKDERRSYVTYFFGWTMQKLWGLAIGFILMEDLKLIIGRTSAARTRFRDGKAETEKNMSEPDRNNTKKSSSSRKSNDGRLGRLERTQSALALIWHELRIRIIQGRNLTPMDHAFVFFGRLVTSDPYVQVFYGQKCFGTTPYISKTLNPVWPKMKSTFRMAVLPSSLEVIRKIECRIFDYDASSSDDNMGTVRIPIPTTTNEPIRGWYSVGKGFGESFCEGAKGELFVEVEVVGP